MERTAISHEYQDIMQASSGQEQLREIDVVEQVMGRVERLAYNHPAVWKERLCKPTAVFSLLTVLLLLSVTAYAATEYIQIRNSKGEVKVQYTEPGQTGGTSHVGADKLEMQAKAIAFAKPGELIAYYVKDDVVSDKKGGTLKFVYKEKRIAAYSDFLKEIRRTGAPVLPEAPGGYSFQYAYVSPNFPNTPSDKGDSLYLDILNELRSEAEKTAGNQKLFMKSVPWTTPVMVNAIYAKDGGTLNISAYLMHGGNMTVWQEQENQTSKVTVAGTEVVINSVTKDQVNYRYLDWYNEEQDAYYNLTSNGDRTLSREKLLQLAGELLQ
ncbi:hypothetical protein GCM10010912_07980 [Paenibacillus albidus]|uniref:DUF4367 domain-containing protein n=1 Tax=Paenibacillus albidus TaxID=2041023 RepID=A0A917C118_9BACL|nr:hypothetical protein [Paenibacillus albidus]GGF65372.1 hypothetical protein GCM10010912_07980 [Paenibacillus albidus]